MPNTKKKSPKQVKKEQKASSPLLLHWFFFLHLLVVIGGCAYAYFRLQEVDGSSVGERTNERSSKKDKLSPRSKQNIDGVRIPEPRKSWNGADIDSRIGKQRCDLALLDMKKGSLEAFEKATALNAFYPVIIRNAMNNWPAMSSSWNDDNFLRKYGNMTVIAGVDIDQAYELHKNSGEKINLAALLQRWNTTDKKHGSLQVHDYGFLHSVPEMGKDFRVPAVFRKWDSPENSKTGKVRHFLSMGPDRSGLPLHSKLSATWLGLLEGEKTYYFYPPGSTAIQDEFEWNYGLDSYSWFLRQEQRIKEPERGVPLVCTQTRGDIIYIPPGFGYATVNSGITTGIGGQYYAPPEERMTEIDRVLSEHEVVSDFNMFMEKAVALDELAHRDMYTARNRHKATKTGVLRLQNVVGNFLQDMSHSEDTWAIQFITNDCLDCAGMAKIWQEAAAALHGIASVGVVDVTNLNSPNKTDIDESWLRFGVTSVPTIIVFKGQQRKVRAHRHFLEEDTVESIGGVKLESESGPDVQLSEIFERVVRFVEEAEKNQGFRGSVLDITSKAHRLRRDAISMVQQAFAIRSNHPKAFILGARLLGPGTNDFEASNEMTRVYIEYLEKVSTEFSSKRSLATIYASLASIHVYSVIGTRVGLDGAIKLLEKAIATDPSFQTPYVDIAFAFINRGQFSDAEKAIRSLEAINPSHFQINKLREQIEKEKN